MIVYIRCICSRFVDDPWDNEMIICVYIYMRHVCMRHLKFQHMWNFVQLLITCSRNYPLELPSLYLPAVINILFAHRFSIVFFCVVDALCGYLFALSSYANPHYRWHQRAHSISWPPLKYSRSGWVVNHHGSRSYVFYLYESIQCFWQTQCGVPI